MNCRITGQLFTVIRSLQEEKKTPKDYGTGQRLFHSEVALLEAVHRNPGTKVSGLSQSLGITKGAVTQQAAKLAEKGLIKIYQQEGNRKEKFYELTEKGDLARKGHEDFHRQANKSLCEYFCSLPEHDTSVILDFLVHLQACVPFCEFPCTNTNDKTERIEDNDEYALGN